MLNKSVPVFRGVTAVLFFSAVGQLYADGFEGIGDQCQNLQGRFRNEASQDSNNLFVGGYVSPTARYVEVAYDLGRQTLKFMLFNEAGVRVWYGEWKSYDCVDGNKVRMIEKGINSGEAGSFYKGDIIIELGLTFSGDLMQVRRDYGVKHSYFGLFPKKVSTETVSIFERIR